jgi:hypothetical protein
MSLPGLKELIAIAVVLGLVFAFQTLRRGKRPPPAKAPEPPPREPSPGPTPEPEVL